MRTGHHAAALATSASSSRASSRASSESSAKLEQRASSAGFGSDGRAGQGGDRHSSIRDLSAAARLEARCCPSASARSNDDNLQSYSYHRGGHGNESIFEAFRGGWSGGTTRGSSSFYSGRKQQRRPLSPLRMGDHIRTVAATYDNCTLVHVHGPARSSVRDAPGGERRRDAERRASAVEGIVGAGAEGASAESGGRRPFLPERMEMAGGRRCWDEGRAQGGGAEHG